MKRLRIYVDTSVIGGCFDDEFAEWSNALMANFRADRYRLVISDVTAAEIAMTPESIREMFTELLADAEFLQISSEAVELASAYESHGILGHGFRNDMLQLQPLAKWTSWSAGILSISCAWIKSGFSTR